MTSQQVCSVLGNVEGNPDAKRQVEASSMRHFTRHLASIFRGVADLADCSARCLVQIRSRFTYSLFYDYLYLSSTVFFPFSHRLAGLSESYRFCCSSRVLKGLGDFLSYGNVGWYWASVFIISSSRFGKLDLLSNDPIFFREKYLLLLYAKFLISVFFSMWWNSQF